MKPRCLAGHSHCIHTTYKYNRKENNISICTISTRLILVLILIQSTHRQFWPEKNRKHEHQEGKTITRNEQKTLAEWRPPALDSCFISSRLFSKIRVPSHSQMIGLTQLYTWPSRHCLIQWHTRYRRHKNHLFSIIYECLHSRYLCKHWHVVFSPHAQWWNDRLSECHHLRM